MKDWREKPELFLDYSCQCFEIIIPNFLFFFPTKEKASIGNI